MNKPKASTLLTITGIGLGILTNVIVAKRTSLAIEKLKEESLKGNELTKKEKTKVLAKAYLPAIGTEVASAACIIASRKIDAKQIALLGGSLVVANKKLKNIESEMNKFLGKEKTKAIKDKVNSMIANDIFDSKQNEKLKKKALKEDEFIFVDSVTGSTFISTLEEVREAEIKVSEHYDNEGYADWKDLGFYATGKLHWAESFMGHHLRWHMLTGESQFLDFENVPIFDENDHVEFYYIRPSFNPDIMNAQMIFAN
jgi:hypothetical protein